ncbi:MULTISPECIES: hypothetical protein [Bifidobacterium]|uniref:Uncharacterized protein n=2 Tax=Bifidobacterium TaxID=1678 RepID=A0A261FNJ1_9BIFI|nr:MULTISPECIES: hypothetical protein [Bifidobacterium]OZG60717.1 hypothetical protein BLEM_1686 [Bifidobacterium lemurum]OZG69615.1 hypothetical protein BEUL_0032 [Bifidobacterium eulemuris]QOL32268.1 hypothetical protein BE0216_07230 [Bifidobacterium eulemuris]QOL35228.1 hypothetical protein BL8807_05095 [Bifidobacterium lemurum]
MNEQIVWLEGTLAQKPRRIGDETILKINVRSSDGVHQVTALAVGDAHRRNLQESRADTGSAIILKGRLPEAEDGCDLIVETLGLTPSHEGENES